WDAKPERLPVFGTIASQFNDPGMNTLYKKVMDVLVEKTNTDLKSTFEITDEMSEKIFVIPPARTRYLSEISENNRAYDKKVNEQVEVAQRLYGIYKTLESVSDTTIDISSNGLEVENEKASDTEPSKLLLPEFDRMKMDLEPYNWEKIVNWQEVIEKYKGPVYRFKVRDKELKIETHTESLSHLQIPKVALPKYQAWGDLLKWMLQENVPGEFPYTS